MKSYVVFLMSVVFMLALSVLVVGQEPEYGGTLTVGIGADIAKWDIHNCSGMIGLGIQRLVTET